MSTRSVIARKTATGFTGVYHHWDGYPSGLGVTLLTRFNEQFERDLPAFLHEILDVHTDYSTMNGWDTKGVCCNCHDENGDPNPNYDLNDRWILTEHNASGSGCEYAYAFDEQAKTLDVLCSYRQNGEKMIGMFGMGDPDVLWCSIAHIDLTAPAPLMLKTMLAADKAYASD